MVSEGVDVPRLMVGVYATSASTPLYFAQAVGRFVRTRRRGELSSIFVPSVPVLLGLAAQLERERDHALDRERADDTLLDDESLERAQEREAASAELLDEYEWQALGSVATFEKVLYDGQDFGTLAEPGSPEEWEFIGIPGILEPDDVSRLLKLRQARQQRRGIERSREQPEREAPMPLHRSLAEQRRLLNSLVSIWARTSGETHAHVHAEVRRLGGGPEVGRATVAQLQARIDILRKRINGR
jgi:superfamily II DNA or RNA helicase